MKIRIKGNSIRFRLTRSEVCRLDNRNSIQEMVDFGNQSLVYSVSCTKENILSISFIGNEIKLMFPGSYLPELQNNDITGYKAKDGHIDILIEKDFTCLDDVEEDQSDNYPNPLIKR